MNTKAILFATVSLCALVAMAAPGWAQEEPGSDSGIVVTGDVTKTENITINETIIKNKFVTVTVHSTPILDGAAEANALVNQTHDTITVDIQLRDPTGSDPNTLLKQDGLQRTGAIGSPTITGSGSINSNTGIVGVNQDVGDFANQANVVSFALTNTLGTSTAAPNRGSFADAQALAEQENENSTSTDIEIFIPTVNRRDLSITDSINSNTGIVGVNQNAGNGNNQLNAVALAVGQGAAVALSDAKLGQENSEITVIEHGTTRDETMLRSVDNNTGITQVNQSNGNFNNQGSVVAFSALTSSVTLGSTAFKP